MQVAAARRALSVVAVIVVIGAAGVGLRAGAAIGVLLEPTLSDPAVTRALVTGLCLVGGGAGIALGVTLPGLAALGPALACAPASAVDRVAAMLGPPLGLGTVGTSLATLPLAAPIAAAGPAGAWGVAALVAALVAATASAGALAAAVRSPRALVRRGRDGAVVSVLVSSLLALVVAIVSCAGDALAGQGSATLTIALSSLTAGLALACWGGRLIRATPRTGAGRGGSRALHGRRGRVIGTAALLLLARRADVRAALSGGALLGLCGLGIAGLAGAPAPSGLLLSVTGAALTAAPCPLAVAGILSSGRHVWRLAPVGTATATAAWLAAATLGLVPPCALALVALVVEGDSAADLGVAVGMALVVWSCALAAGSIVPWRPQGTADQALSLAVTGAAVGAVSLAVSRVGPFLVDAGLPSPLAGLTLVGSATGAAAASLLAVVRGGR